MDVHSFVQKTLLLLDKERDAEIEETQFHHEHLSAKELQGKGVCLLKLEIKSRRHGMYGRLITVFEPETRHRGKDVRLELPANNFSPGDIVGVNSMSSDMKEKPLLTGIVSQISSFQVSIAFEESQDVFELDDSGLFKLIKLANDVTYRRLKMTLNDLDKYRGGKCEELIEILFSSKKVSSPNQLLRLEFVNNSLDDSQKEAVRFALSQKEMAIIHGPPGTGKTTTVVELIIQAVKQGLKVLAAAPSNIAVDNMVEKLAHYKQKIVRIGHPARLLEHLQKYSLDAIVSASEEKGLARDVRTDIEKIMKKMKKAKSGGERAGLRDELKSLQKELHQREKAATAEVLSRADVVLVTLTSAANDGPLKHLKQDHFNLVVIDECSQALEAASWIGLMRASKCVLAGDHLQLPPTIMSKEAAKNGLELSLMERILNTLAKEEGCDIVRMLTTQYRMHSDIMTWSSNQLYEGKLKAHESVADHLLKDLGEVSDSETTESSLLLIDTAGCDLYESELPEEISKGNEGEADIVAAHVKDLISSGVKAQDIAVISPYNLQIELLRVRLATYLPALEIKSVDGFQGREKEAVVISMVRSNRKGEVGFLAERRRINVAITRARRHLAVVCDSVTVSNNPFIKTLVDYMSDRGVVLSAHDYIQEINAVTNATVKFGGETKQSSKQKQKQQKSNKPEVLPTKEEKMEKYRKILSQFAANEKEVFLEFPSSLNSHDRMAIHEVAEKLGLYHKSIGEDKNRHIKISKERFHEEFNSVIEVARDLSIDEAVSTDTNINESIAQSEQKVLDSKVDIDRDDASLNHGTEDAESLTRTLPCSNIDGDKNKISGEKEGKNESSKTIEEPREEEKQLLKEVGVQMCSFCDKLINLTNFDLHTIHCSRQMRLQKQKQLQNNENQTGSKGARKKDVKAVEKMAKEKPLCKVKKAEDVLKNFDDSDFEAMLNSIKELDGKCAFKKCKTLTNVLGSNCEFCTLRFCLNHIMPEIHGCGDAAKESARRTTCREGQLYRGSGVPSHKPNPTKRAQLEKKMEKKMEEVSHNRNRKKKGS